MPHTNGRRCLRILVLSQGGAERGTLRPVVGSKPLAGTAQGNITIQADFFSFLKVQEKNSSQLAHDFAAEQFYREAK